MKNTLKLATMALVLGLFSMAHGAAKAEEGAQKPWIRLNNDSSALGEQMQRFTAAKLCNSTTLDAPRVATCVADLRDLGVPYELVQALQSDQDLDPAKATYSFWHKYKPVASVVGVSSSWSLKATKKDGKVTSRKEVKSHTVFGAPAANPSDPIILTTPSAGYVCINFDLSTAVLEVLGSA